MKYSNSKFQNRNVKSISKFTMTRYKKVQIWLLRLLAFELRNVTFQEG